MDHVVRSLERGERLLWAERSGEARAIVGELGSLDELEPELRDRALILKLRAEALVDEPADRIIVAASRARKNASSPAARAAYSALIAGQLAEKRCDALAREAAQDAIDALPSSSLGHDAMARVHLEFDRRPEALAVWESAASLEPAWRSQLGIVRVSYVMGKFDRAREVLASVAPSDETRVVVLRWKLLLARIAHDLAATLSVMDDIVEHTRGGYRFRWDLLGRASALDWAGRRTDAVDAYRMVWRENESDGAGRFAREVLNNIERGGGGKRVMLPAFPTTTQKRDYCGPAVLELVLRHLGIEADQDAIATTVKLPHAGSPMVRIVGYLEAQKLATRRFEGTAARIRACMELGLPVIVQEEYSTTTHVAVVAGIDEELGMLFVQDPMTHVTAERLTGTESRLGQLFRQAATVAYPASATDIARKLDEADVKDQEHIRLVDSCGDDAVEKDVEEVIARCRRAIDLCEDYPLAWHRQGWELLEAAKRYNSPNNINRFLSTLREIRVRYGQAEWPHQIHAHYLMWQDRFEEALIEFEDALRIDPGDSNNAQYIAEMHDRCDRPQAATRGWWRALEIDASHVRATENFASHALSQGDLEVAEHLARCALVMSPRNPFNHCTASRVAEKLGQHDAAVAHARKCIEVDPDWVPGKRRLAEVLRQRKETQGEALELLLGLCKRWTGWFAPRLEAASLLVEMHRVDDAVTLLKEGIEAASDEPTDLLRAAVEALLDDGRAEEGLALARQVAGDDAPMGLKVVRLQMLARERADREATEVARDLVTRFGDMAHTVAEASLHLPDDEAEEHLRRIVAMTPTYVLARGRLVIKLLGRKPEEALKVASGPVADRSAWVLALRAAGLNDLGRWEEAESTARAVFALDPAYGPSTLELVRAVVRDQDPLEGLEKLRGAKADDEASTRARMTLAMGVSRVDEAIECAGRLPAADMRVMRALTHMAEVDPKYRSVLELRLAPLLSGDPEDDDDRTWLAAVLAGSQGASGDTETFDRALAEAEGIAEVLPMELTLEDVGHLALRKRIVDRARQLAPDAPGVLQNAAAIASATGDRAAARALLERATELYPLDHMSWHYLGQHLLFELDPAGHELLDRALGMSGASFRYPMLTIAGISKLLRGQRDQARRLILQARGLACAQAVPLSILPLETAALAALDGNRAGVEAAAEKHVEPEAKLWRALRDAS